MNYSLTDTLKYDAIYYKGFIQGSTDTLPIFYWTRGQALKTELPVPEALGDHFNLIILGIRHGKIKNAKMVNINAKSPNPPNQSDYIPELMQVGQPFIDSIPDYLSLPGQKVKIIPSIWYDGPIGLYTHSWRVGQNEISQSDTLIIENFTKANSGQYKLFLQNETNAQDTISSNPFVIQESSEIEKPELIKNLDNINAAALGYEFVLNILAKGSNLRYEWFHNEMPLPVREQNYLKFDKIEKKHAGKYYVRVSNDSGSVRSVDAALIVMPMLPILLRQTEGGTINPQGKQNQVLVFPGGDTVFSVVPDSGYALDSVYLDREVQPPPINTIALKNIRESRTLHVVFKPREIFYSICVGDSTKGKISIDHNKTQKKDTGSCLNATSRFGDALFISAIPAEGYQFSKWQLEKGGVNFTPGEGHANLVLRDSTVIKALFTSGYYEIWATVNNGKILKDPDTSHYLYGDTVRLKPVPNEHYRFKSWKFIDGSVSYDTVLTHKMVENLQVRVEFEKAVYEVSAIPEDTSQGEVSIQPDTTHFDWNDTVSLKALPRPGYAFFKWEPTGEKDSVITYIVNGPANVVAKFSPVGKFRLDLKLEPDTVPKNHITVLHGKDTVTSQRNYYTTGDTLLLIANSHGAFKFTNWQWKDSTVTTDSLTIFFSAEHIELTGLFEQKVPLPDVIFDPPSTRFDTDTTLTLSLDSAYPGAIIWYTQDGSEPKANASLPYAEPIIITQSDTVKARAFSGKYLPSRNVVTHIYTENRSPQFTILPAKFNMDSVFSETEVCSILVKPINDAKLDISARQNDAGNVKAGKENGIWTLEPKLEPFKWNKIEIYAFDQLGGKTQHTVHIYYKLPLSKPEAIRATQIERTSIALAWDSVKWVTDYIVYISVDTLNFVPVDTVDTAFYVDSGLTAATDYWYRVRGYYQAPGGVKDSTAISEPFYTHTTIVFEDSITGNGIGKAVFLSPDKGYVVGGTFHASVNSSGIGAAVFDSLGNLKLIKPLRPGVNDEYVHDMIIDEGGGYVLSGQVDTPDLGLQILVAKAGQDFATPTWSHPYGEKGNDIGYGVIQCLDSGYFVVGQTVVSATYKYARAIKLNRLGLAAWEPPNLKTIAINATNSRLNKVIQDSSTGDFFAVGSIDDTALVVKINSDGGLINRQTYPKGNMGMDIESTGDGNFIVVGRTNSLGPGGSSVYLLKIGKDLSVLYEDGFGGTEDDIGNSIFRQGDGAYIVAGATKSYNAIGSDALIMKFNKNLKLEWPNHFGGAGNDSAFHAARAADGGYVLTGTYSGNMLYLIKTDRAGNTKD